MYGTEMHNLSKPECLSCESFSWIIYIKAVHMYTVCIHIWAMIIRITHNVHPYKCHKYVMNTPADYT